MANLYEQAQRFRAEALKGERQAASQVVRAYGRAYTDINHEIERLRGLIQAARDAGREPSAAMLYREGRLQVLQSQVLERIGTFGGEADIIIGGAIDRATEQGARHAGQLLQVALPEGVAISPASVPGQPQPVVPEAIRLASGAVEQAVAVTQTSAPVGQLLSSLGPQAAKAVTDALTTGLAMGSNPRVIARQMRDALGGNLTRALTIARTETLRAYREASRGEYLANSELLEGWVWMADLSNRTCAACIAQHGTLHPLDEIMATHPRCRCSMAPKPRSYRSIGFSSQPEPPPMETGPQWFRRQPKGVQREILGPAKLRAYQAREITLPDVVARTDSPVWGPSTSEAGLNAAKDNAAARRATG